MNWFFFCVRVCVYCVCSLMDETHKLLEIWFIRCSLSVVFDFLIGNLTQLWTLNQTNEIYRLAYFWRQKPMIWQSIYLSVSCDMKCDFKVRTRQLIASNCTALHENTIQLFETVIIRVMPHQQRHLCDRMSHSFIHLFSNILIRINWNPFVISCKTISRRRRNEIKTMKSKSNENFVK